MAIRKMTVKTGQKPTKEQKKRIREAMKRPIVYDDDSPELTEEQYEQIRNQSMTKERKKSFS